MAGIAGSLHHQSRGETVHNSMGTPAGIARLQRAANLRGEMITLDEIHRQTLRHLNGERSLAQLIDILVGAPKAGEFVLHPENDKSVITEEKAMRNLLESALGKVLENLARQSFLAA